MGEDDRFYVHNSKWSELFNGVVAISQRKSSFECTGFVLEGDVIVTAAHCLGQYLDKEGFIDFKKVEKMKVYFDDTGFSLKKRFHMHKRARKPYSVKDIFVEASLKDCEKGSKQNDFDKNEFGFIKLKEPIPKDIKRFNLFKDINLKEYDILDSPLRGMTVSTVGYHTDAFGIEKLAHIGCAVRDSKQYEGVWFFYTDCDTVKGASGSPVFKILKNKKTKEIKLGILGVSISGIINFFYGKDRHYTLGAYNEEDLFYLSARPQYYFEFNELEEKRGQYNQTLSLNNHKLFNKKLQSFIKNSSQWRSYRTPLLKKYDFLKKEAFENKLKSLNKEKLRKYLYSLKDKDLLKSQTCNESVINRLSWYQHSDFLKGEKQEILSDFVDEVILENYRKKKYLRSKKRRSLSYKSLRRAYGISFLNEDGTDKDKEDFEGFLVEDRKKDKEFSDKLWQAYFGE